MSPSDEKTITTTYALNVSQKKVVMQFSAMVQNISIPPVEAAKMATILLNCAKELDPTAVKDHTWPGMNEPIRAKPQNESPTGKPS